MTNQDESFFQEVEEAVRQDRYTAFFNQWGIWIVGAIALVLAGVGGWRFYEGWQVSSSRDHGEAYVAAQKLAEGGDPAAAAAAFEGLTKQGPQIYRVMAMMERAEALIAGGDLEAGLAQFDEAAEAARDPSLRDSARLRAAYIVAETQDFAAVRARLEPIIEAGGPMSYPARELLGVEAWEAGELDLARTTLENLQLAFDAPEPVRQRAQLALAVIGPAAEQPAAAATTTQESSGEPK